jgi:hypothetical protein
MTYGVRTLSIMTFCNTTLRMTIKNAILRITKMPVKTMWDPQCSNFQMIEGSICKKTMWFRINRIYY